MNSKENIEKLYKDRVKEEILEKEETKEDIEEMNRLLEEELKLQTQPI